MTLFYIPQIKLTHLRVIVVDVDVSEKHIGLLSDNESVMYTGNGVTPDWMIEDLVVSDDI